MQTKPPPYRRQRRKNGNDLAYTTVNGTRRYLGRFGSCESRDKYAALLVELRTHGGHTKVSQNEITVSEVAARFMEHCNRYYRRTDGQSTREAEQVALALRFIINLYGRTPAAEFGPLRLEAVRGTMIDAGHARQYINREIHRIRRMFRWAASKELISTGNLEALRTLPGLRAGRTDAREADPVLPVADEIVEATIKHATPTVRAMVNVQRYTGMRPGEVCIMRARDIDMSGDVWVYRPHQHKTQYRGRQRTVYLGRRAQDAIRPYLRNNIQGYLFSPIQSEQERREALHANRKTPLSCGNAPGTNRRETPRKSPSDRYTTQSYGQAVAYACRKAFSAPEGTTGEALRQWRRDHRWAPNRLRHTFATRVRREHGLESAQVLLGHSRADITQVYAERDETKAIEVARKIG